MIGPTQLAVTVTNYLGYAVNTTTAALDSARQSALASTRTSLWQVAGNVMGGAQRNRFYRGMTNAWANLGEIQSLRQRVVAGDSAASDRLERLAQHGGSVGRIAAREQKHAEAIKLGIESLKQNPGQAALIELAWAMHYVGRLSEHSLLSKSADQIVASFTRISRTTANQLKDYVLRLQKACRVVRQVKNDIKTWNDLPRTLSRLLGETLNLKAPQGEPFQFDEPDNIRISTKPRYTQADMAVYVKDTDFMRIRAREPRLWQFLDGADKQRLRRYGSSHGVSIGSNGDYKINLVNLLVGTTDVSEIPLKLRWLVPLARVFEEIVDRHETLHTAHSVMNPQDFTYRSDDAVEEKLKTNAKKETLAISTMNDGILYQTMDGFFHGLLISPAFDTIMNLLIDMRAPYTAPYVAQRQRVEKDRVALERLDRNFVHYVDQLIDSALAAQVLWHQPFGLELLTQATFDEWPNLTEAMIHADRIPGVSSEYYFAMAQDDSDQDKFHRRIQRKIYFSKTLSKVEICLLFMTWQKFRRKEQLSAAEADTLYAFSSQLGLKLKKQLPSKVVSDFENQFSDLIPENSFT